MGAAERSAHGSVTAEAAIVLPIMAAFALTLIWMISVGIAQIQAVDAARDAAREIARGGDVDAATARARVTAPADARVDIDRSAGEAVVTVSFTAKPPRWLFVPLPPVGISASSSVEVERDDAREP
ncbi:MAG TPA: TadE family type IV pilus minor pilin [Nocardioidaceae bacterium]